MRHGVHFVMRLGIETNSLNVGKGELPILPYTTLFWHWKSSWPFGCILRTVFLGHKISARYFFFLGAQAQKEESRVEKNRAIRDNDGIFGRFHLFFGVCVLLLDQHTSAVYKVRSALSFQSQNDTVSAHTCLGLFTVQSQNASLSVYTFLLPPDKQNWDLNKGKHSTAQSICQY